MIAKLETGMHCIPHPIHLPSDPRDQPLACVRRHSPSSIDRAACASIISRDAAGLGERTASDLQPEQRSAAQRRAAQNRAEKTIATGQSGCNKSLPAQQMCQEGVSAMTGLAMANGAEGSESWGE
jgi:hypothetical protein